MPKLTYRQWDEYKAIIKKCQTLEIEARSSRALAAQVDALTSQLKSFQLNAAINDAIRQNYNVMVEQKTIIDALTAQVAKLEAVLLDVLDNTNTSGLQWWFLPGELKPETLLQLNLIMLEADKETPHA